MTALIDRISQALQISTRQVSQALQLLDDGATVPFIARYRKEVTGSLDEVQITQIRDQASQLRELDKRKESVLSSINEQGKLSNTLRKQIEEAQTMAKVEDLYLPYKPKRRTKATIARERGLEPLAQQIFEQTNSDLTQLASSFVNSEQEVSTTDEALQGARDIIAEWINEDQEARETLRQLFRKEGVIKTKVLKGKEADGHKFRDYFEWEEPVAKVPSHRLLAMRRGEKEGFLSLTIAPPEEQALARLERQFLKNNNDSTHQVQLAVADAYKRLLRPSLETEIRLETKKKADTEAIEVFSENLRQLLLAAPLGEKNILALDPGFRTGCKLVCLDRQGKLLEHTTIYPNPPQKQIHESASTVMHLCEKHKIEAIAIGNGTASRETEQFVASQVKFSSPIPVIVVNESGASIYSASEVAREEFPDKDVTVRGAVSIGRRLLDPLAELVKIDPKSIGVGQYQHDVDQNALKQGLEDTVVSCVNKVGVDVNTASQQLLSYVSGIGPVLAKNMVNFRNENGAFPDRKSIKKVSRLGDKVFEQAAGFLRIRGAKNPLDNSAVHPERYSLVQQMARDLNSKVDGLLTIPEVRKQIDIKRYTSEEVGLPTLKDILEELDKPGRDPRERFELFQFQEGVNEMKDLQVGMKLPGIITNVTNFGAFVDVGVHQDGLVHISHLADHFVKDPTQVVKVQQKVQVTVLEVDIPRKRISLSMKQDPFAAQPSKAKPKSQREPRKSNGGNMADQLQQLKNKFR
ncbi:Tex family protein [Tunicatimonas pelagia]|uniref:Tex family protein n=1 Tax=Tunicatimonas pelagia TaxID=931531 RepID=UPI002665C8FC|nr:Tex family protein [Tunicatimonas pelagia]WKN43933.1 Tex family protein [Tunicatimonas pelagia]